MKEEYKKGELAKEILIGISLCGFVVAMAAMPGLARVVPLFQNKRKKDQQRFDRALRKLSEKKLVNIYLKDGNEVVEITKAGRKKVLEYNLEEMKLRVPKKWDGWWRIVMFDIPQSKKQARDAISQKIKDLGLYPIQRSVFVSPYICKDEIDFVGEFFGVRNHIIYIKAKEIEGVRKLKGYFGIS